MKDLINRKKDVTKNNQLTKLNISDKEFNLIMKIYGKALENTKEQFMQIQKILNTNCGYEVINSITSRIKTSESIANKMKKKNYKMTYENLIEKINDIAGIRIVCSFKDDIYRIKSIIEQMENIRILKEKDYIKKAKKSGYSAYHLIIEVPVTVEEQTVFVKIEIQIRTMLMDFWASTEHKVKYKTNKKLSSIDSKKLSIYAKIVDIIGEKMEKIYRKQTEQVR